MSATASRAASTDAGRIADSIPDGTHRLTVGLRPLNPARWIEEAPDHDLQLAEKQRLLDGRDDVVAALDGSREACREVLSLLSAQVLRQFPGRYAREGRRLRIGATGEAVDPEDPQREPLCQAARLVPEDLCLMREDAAGSYRLVAAAVCFPTRWRLTEKMGKPLLAIHAPVPGYAAAVGAATDRLMAALVPERPLWRQNWSLLDSPLLHQPRRVPLARPLAPAELGRRLWLRSERQTLTRLPASRDVMFTIRIRQCTLEALCAVPGAAGRLLRQLRSMPAPLKAYKAVGELEPLLLGYLARHAGPT